MEDHDGPPPRKKISRFFPGGRSAVGGAAEAKKDVSEHKKKIPAPLIEDNAYTVKRESTSLHTSNDDDNDDTEVIDSLTQASDNHQPRPLTPTTQTAFNLKKLTVKDPRRNGIIGIESLLRAASNTPIFANFRSREFKLGQPTNPYQSAPFQSGPLPSHPPQHVQSERLVDVVKGQTTRDQRNTSDSTSSSTQDQGRDSKRPTSNNGQAASENSAQQQPQPQPSPPRWQLPTATSRIPHRLPSSHKAPPGRSMEDIVRAQAAIGNSPPAKPSPPGAETNYIEVRPPVAGPIDPTQYSYSKPPSLPAALQNPIPPASVPARPQPTETHNREEDADEAREGNKDAGPLFRKPLLPSKQQIKLEIKNGTFNGNPVFQQPFLKRPNPTNGRISGGNRGGIDLDRDTKGKKLPLPPPQPASRPPIFNIPGYGITNLPKHATLTPSRENYHSLSSVIDNRVPPNYYTCPDRIVNALLTSRKRKRNVSLIPPPPAFTYQRTNNADFNIFDGFLLYPELIFALASILPLRDLISLYAISRDFHTIIDTRFTTVVLSQSLRKAPECSRAFPFRCYLHLCRKDPAARIPHPNPAAVALGNVRLIPSFRWLAFILHREKVVHELMAVFAEDGVPLPARCSLALKRMWFIFDIPDNARRIGYIHNVNLFTDLDLYFAMCFFVKLDMRLNDPVAQEKRDGVRRMLMGQESLTTVLKVLRRDRWTNRFELMREWVRFRYDPLPDEAGLDIFGIPAAQVGKLKFEYWGKTPPETLKRPVRPLLRPDQLVTREAIKRGLRFHRHFLRCLTYGYVRMDTLENYAPRAMTRRQENLKDEYEADDDIGGLTWRMEKAGLEGEGDDVNQGQMLDLGERKQVSLLCIEGGNRSMISKEERLKMEEQERFLQACMAWSAEDREDGDADMKMLLD